MAKYKVIWEENMSIIIEAKTQKEAEEKISSGEYDNNEVIAGEITMPPEAYKTTY